MTVSRPRPTAPLVAGVVCGLVTLVALAVLPFFPDARETVPGHREAAWWVSAVGVLIQSAALAQVGKRPRVALTVVALPVPVMAFAGAGDATSVTSLAIATAVFLAALSRPFGMLVWPLLVAACCMWVGTAIAAADMGTTVIQAYVTSLAQSVGTFALAILIATWNSALRESRRARTGQEQAMAREQSALVQAAIASERTDMARELHDIAAHHLTGIAVLAAAVERQIDTDPAGAKKSVHQVRTQSTKVLRDLRSLVGLLREGDSGTDARTESLAGIPDLVDEVAAAGREVSLHVIGDLPPEHGVGPLAQLAAFRAVQEALANAGRHAPGAPCRVQIDSRPANAVFVTIHNDPAATDAAPSVLGSGFGLLGMHERAQLTNARLTAGPTDTGGWQVAMRLPRDEESL